MQKQVPVIQGSILNNIGENIMYYTTMHIGLLVLRIRFTDTDTEVMILTKYKKGGIHALIINIKTIIIFGENQSFFKFNIIFVILAKAFFFKKLNFFKNYFQNLRVLGMILTYKK